MTPLLTVLLAVLPIFIWVIPLAKGAKEIARSEKDEAISKDTTLRISQRSRFVGYALCARKRSEKHFLWFGILVFLHYFTYSLLCVLFPVAIP